MDKSKNKENAVADFMEMIEKSWTWERLTEQEREAFKNEVFDGDYCAAQKALRGNYMHRWCIMLALYGAFLAGVGYTPIGWREPNEDAPRF